jgi:hypothetical protein
VDFDLRLSFRLADVIAAKPANSGVMYRSRRIRNWQVRGYQCDLQRPYTGTLILLEDANDPRSPWGHSVLIKATNGPAAIKSTGVLTPADKFKQTIKTNDWNELVIVAKGNRITHKINGVVTLDAIDQTQSGSRDGALPGLLALELKRATILEFKDIHLKRL